MKLIKLRLLLCVSVISTATYCMEMENNEKIINTKNLGILERLYQPLLEQIEGYCEDEFLHHESDDSLVDLKNFRSSTKDLQLVLKKSIIVASKSNGITSFHKIEKDLTKKLLFSKNLGNKSLVKAFHLNGSKLLMHVYYEDFAYSFMSSRKSDTLFLYDIVTQQFDTFANQEYCDGYEGFYSIACSSDGKYIAHTKHRLYLSRQPTISNNLLFICPIEKNTPIQVRLNQSVVGAQVRFNKQNTKIGIIFKDGSSQIIPLKEAGHYSEPSLRTLFHEKRVCKDWSRSLPEKDKTSFAHIYSAIKGAVFYFWPDANVKQNHKE